MKDLDKTQTRPGYKNTRLGWIPDEWEVDKLGLHSTFQSGFAFSSKLFVDEDGRRLLIPKNFTKHGSASFTKENSKYTIEQADDKFICRPGDLLVLLTDLTPSCELLGKPVLLKEEDGEVLLNQRIVRVQTSSEIEISYLTNYMLTKPYHHRIRSTCTGTTVRHSSNNELGKVLIPIPPLPEQKAIAQTLSTWDRAIRSTEQLIAACQERKKGLMQQLLSGKTRFPGFTEPWEEVRLGDIGFIKADQIKPQREERYNYYSIPAWEGGRPKEVFGSEIKSNKLLLKSATIIFGKLNPRVWKVWRIEEALNDNQAIASTEFLPVMPKPEFSNEFIYQLMKSSILKGPVTRIIGGSTGSHKRVSPTGFYKIKVKVPVDIKEQDAIARYLVECDKEIDSLSKQCESLRDQKKGLMQQLLTGQVRVNTKTEAHA